MLLPLGRQRQCSKPSLMKNVTFSFPGPSPFAQATPAATSYLFSGLPSAALTMPSTALFLGLGRVLPFRHFLRPALHHAHQPLLLLTASVKFCCCCICHGDPAADQIVRGPSGGCRGDLISTPDFGYSRVFYKSFLRGNLRFGGCFEKPSLQALFWSKSFVLGKKLAKLRKEEDR